MTRALRVANLEYFETTPHMIAIDRIAEVFYMNGAERQTHGIQLEMRKEMHLTGIREVISFDEQCAVFRSACGELSVEGADLKVGVLDTDRGVVTLSGKVDAMYYTDEKPEEKKGFLGKLFR